MATTDLGKVKGSSVYSFPIDSLGMLYIFGEVSVGGSTYTDVVQYAYCFKVPNELVDKLLDGDSVIAYLPESTRAALAAIDAELLDMFYGGLSINTDPPMRTPVVPFYFDNPLEQMIQWDDTTSPYPGSSVVYYGSIANGDYVLYILKVDVSHDDTGVTSETLSLPGQLGGDLGKSFVLLDITGQTIRAPASSSTMNINVVNGSFYDNVLSVTIEDTYAMLVSDDININGTIIPLLSDVNGSSEQPEARFSSGKLRYNTAFYNALMAGEFPTIKPVPFISDEDFTAVQDILPNEQVAVVSKSDNLATGSTVYGTCHLECVYDYNTGLSWTGSLTTSRAVSVTTLVIANDIDNFDALWPLEGSGHTYIADVMSGNTQYGRIRLVKSSGTYRLDYVGSRSLTTGTSYDIIAIPYTTKAYPIYPLDTSAPTIKQLFSMVLPDWDFATFVNSDSTSGVASKTSVSAPPHTFVTAEQFKSNAVTHWERYDILDLAFTASQDVTVSNNSSFLITDGHTVQLFIEADIVFNSTETANAYPILTLINVDGTSTFSEQIGGGTQYKDAVLNMAVTDKSLYTATGYIAQRNKSTNNLEDNYMPGASVKYAGYDMQGTTVYAVALFINALGVPDDGFLTTKKYNFHLSATYPIN